MTALSLLLALLASAPLLGLLYRQPLVMPWNRSRTAPAGKAQRVRRPKSARISPDLPAQKGVAAEDARDQDGPSFDALTNATQVIVPRADVPRLRRAATWPWPADPSTRITVTDDLDRALLSVQIEIIDRVRRQEEAELLGEPDNGAPPPLLLVATPGDARERIEAVLALGRPYGITGLLLEEPHLGRLSETISGEVVSCPARGGADGECQVAHVPASREVAVIETRARPLQFTQSPAPAGLIRLLGHYAVEGAAGQRGGRSADMWALLGLLAEHRTCLLSRSTAEAKLWPDQEGSTHRFPNLLKDTRVKLCDALGRPHNQGRHVIENIGATGYRINPRIYTCDVWQLRDLLSAAGQATGEQRAATLTKAVALYTGPYLPDSQHSWAENAAQALDREVVQALTQLATLETEPERAVLHLEKATQIDATAQHLYRRRMQIYGDLGRLEAVHHCYDQLSERLKARGTRPEGQTLQLYRHLTGSE